MTTGLLALALRRIGVQARSWQNWQIPFRTDTAHSKARVADIPEEVIGKSMDEGVVAIVPGFQGITDNDRITTLGRGGSDTSAVALAAALKAEGIAATEPALHGEYAPDYWATFFTHPDGLRLEVTNFRLHRRERLTNWDGLAD